ncbi:alanine racemase [Sulfurimonas sp.]|uniref:alanine racemase n=1 Tax=Sulfurimonas sp. TaxID=2022749 RepID=UPI002614A6B8|nr:alanine racemase [Sulfurimonas sp.]
MAFITLNKTNFFNNLDIITQLTCTKDKIALVLKDNAYGHGLLEVAAMAVEYGITKAVVRSCEEAQKIENYFSYILVLSDIPATPSQKIRYTINDLAQIKKFAKDTKVELKVDSGMNRNGIEMSELSAAFRQIQKQKLQLEAVFTHHSSADEKNEIYDLQNNNFIKIKKEAQKLAQEYGFSPLRFHSCNSAALFREEDFNEDMARVGIGAYGCLELEDNENVNKLAPILALYGEKLSSRLLKEGECVGYSATFKTQEQCRVSNYDIGYGDGFLRSCSNHYVTPQNIKIAGRISMDNSSFITDKESLLIFNDARVAAKQASTISYEVLTSLKPYLKRSVIEQ